MLSIGDTVNIKLKSISNKNISAKIVSIYDTIDTKKIEVKFDELENVYMQPAEITYENESDVYDMVLPNSAIKYDGKNYYINVIDKKENFIGTDYTARRVFVRILDKNDSATAISSEIAINEKVIIYSNKFIEKGEKVYVKSIE